MRLSPVHSSLPSDHNLSGHTGFSQSGNSLADQGYTALKVQAGSRVKVFDQQTYNLRGLDNTCGSCNCAGNSLGHNLYWHGGRGGCYGSSHYGLSLNTGDVHISCGSTHARWYGHFHRSGVDTGVYGFDGQCINESEWGENFKLYAGKPNW